MDRLDGVTMRTGTGWRYLNIDEDGKEIGNIYLTEDVKVSGVWAEHLSDKVWIPKVADFCQHAVRSAEVLRSAADQKNSSTKA